MVWAMHRKRRIDTRQVYKWNARLNVHGGQQEHGVNFWETYAPVVSWQTLRLFFIHSILKRVEQQTDGFCTGIPSCPSRSTVIYTLPKGIQIQRWDQ